MRACSTVKADTLCDPEQETKLPFPLSFAPLPVDRFTLSDDRTFSYMGRESFSNVFSLWSKAHSKQGLSDINVYGTPG